MKTKINQLLVGLFVLTSVVWLGWWLSINVFHSGLSADDFTDSYGIVAFVGALVGLIASKRWGGFKSKFGRAIGFLAVGMGLQFMGQVIYTLYYRLGDVELAFPSIGDAPYLISNFAYILGAVSLLGVLCYGRKITKPWWKTGLALAVTGVAVYLMTVSFLDIAVTDDRGTLYQALNVAYPLVQAVYFFLGVLALLQSRILAGAKMFYAVTVMILALITQFFADFVFLNTSYNETWVPAGKSELIYLLAYIMMGTSIIMIDRVRSKAVAVGVTEKE